MTSDDGLLRVPNHPHKEPDIHFTPVPDRVLAEMLRLAEVGPEDLVYDLGCGDGRIVIAAVQAGARLGVGVDIDPLRVAESLVAAELAGVTDRVEFREENFFATDLRPATVLALYLLDSLNVRLRPKIFAECRPGTRVVTYSFEMGQWECDAHTAIAANGVSLWVVPANVSGRWIVRGGTDPTALQEITIEQTFQRLAGSVIVGGTRRPILHGTVKGSGFGFTFDGLNGPVAVSGGIDGESMEGVLTGGHSADSWQARRFPDTQAAIEG